MRELVRLFIALPFLSSVVLAQSTTPSTQPSQQKTPFECLESLAKSLASGDVAAIKQYYQPPDKDAPSAEILVSYETASRELNEAVKNRWGKDAPQLAPSLAEDLRSRPKKAELTENGNEAYFHNPNLGNDQPSMRFKLTNGLWAVTMLCDPGVANIFSGWIAALRQTKAEVLGGHYNSAQEAAAALAQRGQALTATLKK